MENVSDLIRSPTLKGSQLIAGIWFPAQWFDDKQRRSLLIKYWFLGCSIYQFAQGDLLKFPTPKSIYCESLDGWPLVYQSGTLCSTILPEKIQQQLSLADLVLIEGNQVTVYHYDEAVKLDPATWVNLDDYELYETENYAISMVYGELSDLTEESKSIEEIFDGKVPTPSQELMKFTQQRKQNLKQQSLQSQASTQATPKNKNSLILWIAVLSFLFGLFRYISSRPSISSLKREYSFIGNHSFLTYLLILIIGFIVISNLIRLIKKIIVRKKVTKYYQNSNYGNRYTDNSSETANTKNLDENVQHSGKRENNSTGIKARSRNPRNPLKLWRNYLTYLAIFSKLSRLIAFRQGKYLDTMMKMFENGNLEEALRYAMPINGDSNSDGQSFGVPKPRNKLSLSERCYGNGSSMYVDPQLHNRLQTLYRQSFEKLAKENRIEEAVFVLVELMNNLKEGIEFLEKHQRYKQAMQMAIARDADADLIVRLCCLANDWDKAIMIARRDNAFANAVLMLEKTEPELANKLRLEWANTLAEKAEWLAAIDAIWPLTEYRYLAEQWFKYTDQLNAKALVKRFILLPDSLDKFEDCLTAIRTNPEYYQKRLDIALEILVQEPYIDKLRGLLRVFINVIIADVIKYPNKLTQADIARLIELTQDKSLKVDMPSYSLKLARTYSLLETNSLQLWSCPDAGSRTIYDMVALNDDNYLLALGEAGIMMVDKTGKQLAYFMIAAYSFVISHNRQQVLALAKREGYYRIHKVDLSIQNTTDLGCIEFQLCLWVFDGINWTIVNNNCIQVIDISKSLSIVWRVDLSPNQIRQMVVNNYQEIYLTTNPSNEVETWGYSTANRHLNYRNEVDSQADKIILSDSMGILHFKYSHIYHKLLCRQNFRQEYQEIPLTISAEQFDDILIFTTGDVIVLFVQHPNEIGLDIHLYHYQSNSIKMSIAWHTSDSVSNSSIITGECCFFDKQGRAFHVNINENTVTSFSI